MRKINYIAVSLFLFGGFACKKQKYPESSVVNEKVFYMNATIDGTPVSITAGVNSYYMYSSFAQNANGLYTLVADLKQTDCTTCPNSIGIRINDFKISTGNAAIQINQALYPHNYPLVAGPSYSSTFCAMYNKAAPSYTWNFGDGSSAVTSSSVISHVFPTKGKYDVKLTVAGNTGCYGSISNPLKFGFPSFCSASIIADSVYQQKSVAFSAITSGALPFSYFWDFGDGSVSSLAKPTHTYAYNGSYPVSLKVIDANNDTAFASYNVVTKGDLSSCTTNFTASPAVQVDPLVLSGVTINWRDESGTVYTSDNFAQPATSAFEILSVEDFTNNENGQKTKKIHVKFKCRVYNGALVKTIDNAEAIICVSYQ